MTLKLNNEKANTKGTEEVSVVISVCLLYVQGFLKIEINMSLFISFVRKVRNTNI